MDARESSPIKEAARQEWHRQRAEPRWRLLLEGVQEGKHVSPERLARLIRSGGVPVFAGPYVADRLTGVVGKLGRPAVPPLDPSDLDTLWYHFDGGSIPWTGIAARGGVESLLPTQFAAVDAVRDWTARYKAFRTAREPRSENKLRLRFVKSEKKWRVKDPKGEARRRVARDWGKVNKGVSESTLAAWERRIAAFWRRARARLPQHLQSKPAD